MSVRLLLVSVLATLSAAIVAVGFSVAPAAACSCQLPDTGDMLRESEAAFIGTYQEALGELEGGEESEFGHLFKVDRWLKGPFEDGAIVVATPEDGSACGFSFDAGAFVAVFLHDLGDGVPNSGLCSYVDGESALAAFASPTVDPDAGPAVFAVTEREGSPHLWLLDEGGRRVGFAEAFAGADHSALLDTAVCPDSDLFVEAWHGPASLVIRDLSTLEVVDVREAPENVLGVACLDSLATDIRVTQFAATSSGAGAIVDVATGARIDLVDDTRDVVFGPDGLALAFGPFGIDRVDLDTGVTTGIYQTAGQQQGQSQPDIVAGISLHPDGGSVAFEITHYRRDGPVTTTAIVIELATGAATVSNELDVVGALLMWVSEDQLVLTTSGGPSYLVDGETLTIVDEFDAGLRWRNPVPRADRVLLVDEPNVVVIDPASDGGASEVIATLPIESHGELTPLARPVVVTADFPIDHVDEAAGSGDAAADRSAGDPDEAPAPASITGWGWWLLVALVGLAGVGAWLLANRRTSRSR